MTAARHRGRSVLVVAALALVGCPAPAPFTDAAYDARPDVIAARSGDPCGLGPNGEPLGGCTEGQFCLTPHDGFPGGYCAPDCLRRACPADAACFPVSATRQYCVRSCTTDADCRVAEGYVCRQPAPGAHPACLPNNAPVGHRAGGAACFSSELSDAGAGTYLAPLPVVSFTAPTVAVSRGRLPLRGSADAVVAPDSTSRGGAVVLYTGYDQDAYWNGVAVRVSNAGDVGVPGVIRDHELPNVLQPGGAFDRAGVLHGIYLANYIDRPGDIVRHIRSADGGDTLTDRTVVFRIPECVNECVSPVLAVGPRADGSEAVVAGVVAPQTSTDAWVVVARSPAAMDSFGPTVQVGGREMAVEGVRTPRLAAVSAGPARDAVYVTWEASNVENAAAGLGDTINRVRLRVSTDGGQTFGPVRDVARSTDAPVEQQPQVGAGGGALHVVYVNGGLDGRWDVVLATSRDDGVTFAYRTVNDDPERCATHGFAGLAVDPATGDAHVLFLDNRFGAGMVVYARCPADPAQRCGRNERVSDAAFVFTTSLDAARWHGSHSSLALGTDGSLWATWSDTRTGSPEVYLARGRNLVP